MKKTIAGFIGLSIIILLPFYAEAYFQKTKIAVLDFQLQGEGFETADMGKIVAEWFITAFVRHGRFDVVERGLLTKILNEQKLGETGIIDENTATKIGKLLGVKVIISGSVMKLQSILEINARIIDVETASIITAERTRSPAAIKLQSLVDQMADKIIKSFPLDGYIVHRQDDIVMINPGRTAGVKKEMIFIVYKEGRVIKHPKTGEVLDIERIETGKLKVIRSRDKVADAVIIEEKNPGDVAYGQSVQSVVDPMKPSHGKLFVNTGPGQFNIHILNLGRRYTRGMTLESGQYEVEVSADGYIPKRRWVSLRAGEEKTVDILPEKYAQPVIQKQPDPVVKAAPAEQTVIQEQAAPPATVAASPSPAYSGVRIAILPWKLSPAAIQYNPASISDIASVLNKNRSFRPVYSYYPMKIRPKPEVLDYKFINDETVERLWSGTQPNVNLMCDIGNQLHVDAVFTIYINVKPWDPDQGKVKTYMIHTGTKKIYSSYDATNDFEANGGAILRRATERILRKFSK